MATIRYPEPAAPKEYAKYSGFEQGQAEKTFTPEVVEALKYNDRGGKNVIVGGQIVERDPGFAYTAPLPAGAEATIPKSDPIADYYTNLNRQAPTEADEVAIREKARKAVQGQLDSIDAQFAVRRKEVEIDNKDRSGRTRAAGAYGGISTSSFGRDQMTETGKYNQEQINILEAEKQAAIQEVLTGVENRAREDIRLRKEEADKNSEKYIQYLTESRENARTDMTKLAGTGAILTPVQKQALMKQTGYEEFEFDSIYNANKPKPERVDYKFEVRKDGSLIRYGDDGSFTVFEDTKIPAEVDAQIITGQDGTILFIDKNNPYNEDGTVKYQRLGNFAKPAAPRRSGSGGGSGGKVNKDEAVNVVDAFFSSRKGGDNRVSPETWAEARKSWAEDGLSVTEFDSKFKNWINPNYARDYGFQSDGKEV